MRRSYLYIPGDRTELVNKPTASQAHAVIVDLEDAVAAANKESARRAVAELLARRDRSSNQEMWIRVDPDALRADVEIAHTGEADGIVLAKSTTETVSAAHTLLDELEQNSGSTGGNPERAPMRISALIESARGILDAVAIAGSPRVVGLAMGEADLRGELGITPGPDAIELLPLRSAVVVASIASGLRPPTGAANVNFRDLESFRETCEQLRRLGFGARSAIHPDQVPIINEVFSPTQAELEAARVLVERFDQAANDGSGLMVSGDGSMVDEAVVRSARRLLGEAI